MSLENLPTELVWAIDDILGASYASRLALRLTSRPLHFHLAAKKLSRPSGTLCETVQLWSWRATDPSRRFCQLCKMWYPERRFAPRAVGSITDDDEARDAAAVLKSGFGALGGPGMVDLPPDCCLSHQSLLIEDVVVAGNNLGNASPPRARWQTTQTKLCMHCGRLRNSLRLAGACACLTPCLTCGERLVNAYVRLLGNAESGDGSRGFVVYKVGGAPYVREWFSANPAERPAFDGKKSRRRGEDVVAVDFRVEPFDGAGVV